MKNKILKIGIGFTLLGVFFIISPASAQTRLIRWASGTFNSGNTLPVATTTLSGNLLYINATSSASGACVGSADYYLNIYQHTTGALLASTTVAGVPCITGSQQQWDLNVPIYVTSTVGLDLQVVGQGGTSISFGSPDNAPTGFADINTVTIQWTNPEDGEELNGWPSNLHFNIISAIDFGGFVTGYVNGDQGQTIGSFFPAGVTPYNYPTPSFATTSLSWAHICIGSGSNCEIASSTISFLPASTITIDTGTGIGPTYPSGVNASATSSPFFVDCSAYSISLFSSSTLAGIGCVAKKTALDVVAILFVPSDSILNGYATLSLNNKFPFAYWYDLKETFESVNASSTGAFPSLSIKFKNVNGTTTTLPVFSSSSISTYVGSSNISLFRTLMQAALWLAFAYFVYRKIKAIFNNDNTNS